MSTIMRRRRGSRTNLGPYKRSELLFGEIRYPVQGYSGYGDGVGRDVEDFISDEMRADWKANREELIAFWKSGKTIAEAYPADCLPWLPLRGKGPLPWAAQHLDEAHAAQSQ